MSLTATLGAEIIGIDLGEVSRDDEQFAALQTLLLTTRCSSSAIRR